MRNKKELIKNFCRDLISLGGIPFFILVLVRVFILNKPDYFLQFIVSGVIFLIFLLVFKQNIYSGLALIILFFSSRYYGDFNYSLFGSIAYVFLIGSLFWLKYDYKKIMLGIILGAISIFGILWIL